MRLGEHLETWAEKQREGGDRPWTRDDAGFSTSTHQTFCELRKHIKNNDMRRAADLLRGVFKDGSSSADHVEGHSAIPRAWDAHAVDYCTDHSARDMLASYIGDHAYVWNDPQGHMVQVLGGPTPAQAGPPAQIPYRQWPLFDVTNGHGESGRMQVLEAPTGTGKTLGYLIPAGYWLKRGRTSGGDGLLDQVIVTTHTKSLQRQLRIELYKLSKWMNSEDRPRKWGPPVRFQHLEGRDNYVDPHEIASIMYSIGSVKSNQANLLCALCAFLLMQKDALDQLVGGDRNPFYEWCPDNQGRPTIMSCFALTSDFDVFLASYAEDDEKQDDWWNDIDTFRRQWLDHPTSRTSPFYRAAAEWAEVADVVIGNHALILTNTALWPTPPEGEEGVDGDDGQTHPTPVKALVIDEAHNWESAATECLKKEVSSRRLKLLLDSFYNERDSQRIGFLARIHGAAERKAAAIDACSEVTAVITSQLRADRNDIRKVVDEARNGVERPDAVELVYLSRKDEMGVRDLIGETVVRLHNSLRRFADFANQNLPQGHNRAQEKLAQLAGVNPPGFIAQIHDWIHGMSEGADAVRRSPTWETLLGARATEPAADEPRGLDGYLPTLTVSLEYGEGGVAQARDWTLSARQVDIASALTAFYQSSGFCRVLFTSATLSIDHTPDGYEQFEVSCGITAPDNNWLCQRIGPLRPRLDYASNVFLETPNIRWMHQWALGSLSDKVKDGVQVPLRNYRLANALSELIWRVGGRTLVLFSSRRAMEKTKELVEKYFEARLFGPAGRVEILLQDDEPDLPAAMENNDRLVVFGLKRCWEGLDVSNLKLVCLDTVYNPPPSKVGLCRALLHSVRDDAGDVEAVWNAIQGHRIVTLDSSPINAPDGLAEAVVRMQQQYHYPRRALLTAQGFGRLLRNNSNKGGVLVFGLLGNNEAPNAVYHNTCVNSLLWNFQNADKSWHIDKTLANWVMRALPGFTGPGGVVKIAPDAPLDLGLAHVEFRAAGNECATELLPAVNRIAQHAGWQTGTDYRDGDPPKADAGVPPEAFLPEIEARYQKLGAPYGPITDEQRHKLVKAVSALQPDGVSDEIFLLLIKGFF